MYWIYHFGVVVFFFSPRQIRSLSSVSSVENDKHLVIIDVYGPQLENSCPVFSCCFSHAIFGLQEMPRTYWCCGWSWTLSLPLSRRVLLPTPGLYGAQQCCSHMGACTGSVPGNMLPASQPWGARAGGTRSRQSPGAAGHLGLDLSFEKSPSESHLLYLTLHSPVFLLV